MPDSLSVVMLGATGAVGGEAVKTLLAMPDVSRLTLLGRRPLESATGPKVLQYTADIHAVSSYQDKLAGHSAAICTLGVGQPSKMSKAEYLRTDRDAVLAFATACKLAGIQHFELLGAVGANAKSPSFYLKGKGQLEEGLAALGFRRLSLFRPSMILTPTNRYGFSQALTLAVWPWLNPLFVGPMGKFKGVKVETLGAAMARNLAWPGSGLEVLHWDEFQAVAGR
jgi:uncharacterized protein YbjT (DUF2867 family)